MKTCSGKDFAKILGKKGWVLVRINGIHHIYSKDGVEQKISLPVHGNKSLKLGMQKFFMKVAQITDSDLI